MILDRASIPVRDLERSARFYDEVLALLIHEGEPFWGYDRLPLLEEKLRARGLERSRAKAPAHA